MKNEHTYYLPFMLSGVLAWSFFSSSLIEATDSLVGNQSLISKIPVPIQVFPFVIVVTNFSTLIFAIPIIALIAWASGITPNLYILLILPFFIALLVICYAIGTILSMAYVYFRDIKHAMGLLLQIWFYATPIVYEKHMIPEKYRFIIYANPIGACFIGIQEAVLGVQANFITNALGASFWTLVSLIFLRITFQKLHRGLPEIL